MKKGEIAILSVAQEYAFGSTESKQELAVVPLNCTVTYEIELASFVKICQDKESWDLSTKEKIDAAEMKKEERNVLFKAGIYLSLKAVSEGNAAKYIEYDMNFDEADKKNTIVHPCWTKTCMILGRVEWNYTLQNREHERMILVSVNNGLHLAYGEETALLGDIYSLMSITELQKEKNGQFQVNTKFLNSLPPEWSKFVTDVKLVKDLHTSNFDQLHAYLEQHELDANEVRIMRERNQDPLAFVGNQQMTPPSLQHLSSLYTSSTSNNSFHHH
ncbi:integrase, catalytic region, zinc finger, CCHC-type containing protein [Tanacetum coccineum]